MVSDVGNVQGKPPKVHRKSAKSVESQLPSSLACCLVPLCEEGNSVHESLVDGASVRSAVPRKLVVAASLAALTNRYSLVPTGEVSELGWMNRNL